MADSGKTRARHLLGDTAPEQVRYPRSPSSRRSPRS